MIPKSMLEELQKKDLKAQSKGLDDKLANVVIAIPSREAVGGFLDGLKAKSTVGIGSLGNNVVGLSGELLKLGFKGAILTVCAVANVVNDTLDAKAEKKEGDAE